MNIRYVHTCVVLDLLVPQCLPDPESIRGDRFLLPAADYESELTWNAWIWRGIVFSVLHLQKAYTNKTI